MDRLARPIRPARKVGCQLADTPVQSPQREGVSGVPAQTRGFLFSDLRGYSAFTERHGDRAARELLTRYRRVVREAIASFGGAEIRTEGDSFYVVFDSVSQAVEAGLAIRAGLDAEHGGEPIRAGIGIHAGEVEDDAEQGIVSSAVNIAARICAVADPGEVLVSETVRSLTRSYLEVTFVARGRRRLKGIADPMPVYRVVPSGTPAARAVRPQRGIAIVGGILVLAVGGAALASQLGNPSVVTPSASQDDSPSLLPPSVSAPVDAEVLDEDQRANLAYIAPGRHEQCGPALPEDGPKFRNVGGLEFGAPAPIASMATSGGIHCQFSRSTSGPSSVWMWRLSQMANPSAPVNAREWMASHGGQVGASEGVCTSDHTPILETWTFSGRSGQLLCFTSVTGDAIVYWTYDGTNVLGKAIRDDKDMAVLLDWWRAEARLAGR